MPIFTPIQIVKLIELAKKNRIAPIYLLIGPENICKEKAKEIYEVLKEKNSIISIYRRISKIKAQWKQGAWFSSPIKEQFDEESAVKLQEKMAKGKLTLDDFMGQMKQMKKMGPLKQILKLMPGMGSQVEAMGMQGNEMESMEAIISSMTQAEKNDPSIIEASRRRRIAKGSGTQPQDVSGMVKSFSQAANMMQQMAGMGAKDRMNFASQMGQMGMNGQMPGFKKKQRSKRLSPKEKAKRRGKKKKGGKKRR